MVVFRNQKRETSGKKNRPNNPYQHHTRPNWTRTVLRSFCHLQFLHQSQFSNLINPRCLWHFGNLPHAALSCSSNLIHPLFTARLREMTSHHLLSDIPCPPCNFRQAAQPRSEPDSNNTKDVEALQALARGWDVFPMVRHASRSCCNWSSRRTGWHTVQVFTSM